MDWFDVRDAAAVERCSFGAPVIERKNAAYTRTTPSSVQFGTRAVAGFENVGAFAPRLRFKPADPRPARSESH